MAATFALAFIAVSLCITLIIVPFWKPPSFKRGMKERQPQLQPFRSSFVDRVLDATGKGTTPSQGRNSFRHMRFARQAIYKP